MQADRPRHAPGAGRTAHDTERNHKLSAHRSPSSVLSPREGASRCRAADHRADAPGDGAKSTVATPAGCEWNWGRGSVSDLRLTTLREEAKRQARQSCRSKKPHGVAGGSLRSVSDGSDRQQVVATTEDWQVGLGPPGEGLIGAAAAVQQAHHPPPRINARQTGRTANPPGWNPLRRIPTGSYAGGGQVAQVIRVGRPINGSCSPAAPVHRGSPA
jgi:hypothetical protein